MPFIIDIVLLLILVISVIFGLKRGFFKTLIDMFSTLIAILIAYFTHKAVGHFLSEKYVLPKISEMIKNLITSNGTVNDIAKMFSEKKNFFISIIDRFSNMKSVESYYNSVKDSGDVADKIARYMARPISETICRLIAFVAILIAALIIIKIIAYLVGLTLELPVLKQADGLLGFVFGAVIGIIIIWILAILIAHTLTPLMALYPKLFPEGKTAQEVIDSTLILRLLNKISPQAVITALTK